MEDKTLKVEFAPGCFDSFEGTQEELAELIAEIHRMVESGDFGNAEIRPLEEDDLTEEEWAALDAQHEKYMPNNRNLQ